MWGAHQVDGRISAKNAVKIRAALRQSIDARQVYEMYQATSPAVSDNNAQDRARARAWAIMNVRFINESLRTALMRLFAEAWVTGEAAAGEAIYEEEALRKAGEIGAIDWSKWQPGDEATALLLKPTGAFKRILDKTGTTITGLDKTGYELVGTALADSIRAGYSPKKAAKLILDTVGSPARALSIAVTESSRVMNSAAIDRYQEAGIDTMQWSAVAGGGTSVACDVCAQNAGEKRKIGQPFPTGKTQPPQHPHCRCNLRPVVPDYDDMFDAQGNLLPLKPNEFGVSDIMPSENTFGGIPESKIRNVRNRGSKLMDTPKHGKGADDLAAAYEEMGYNGLPKVVDADEFAKLAKTADAKVYRGLSGRNDLTAEYFMDEYKYGDHFAGYGVYGNGTYSSNQFTTALSYSGSASEKTIMNILIPDTSNFIEFDNLRDKMKAIQAEIGVVRNNAKAKLVEEAKKLGLGIDDFERTSAYTDWVKFDKDLSDIAITVSDSGTAATLWGYDGFYIDNMTNKDEIYYIILNRAKVVIQK